MKIGWFFFTQASDGFDIIVRDQGADNGSVIATVSVIGTEFEKFAEEILVSEDEVRQFDKDAAEDAKLPAATSEDFIDEPDPVVEPVPEDDPEEDEPEAEGVADDSPPKLKTWFNK